MVAANVPEVPGGGGAIAGVIGVAITALATYFGTRYTTRASHQQSLNDVARQEIAQIFDRHAAELNDRDARRTWEVKERDDRISQLEAKVNDLEAKNDLCERRVVALQMEIQQLRNVIEQRTRPWDGQTERRRDD